MMEEYAPPSGSFTRNLMMVLILALTTASLYMYGMWQSAEDKVQDGVVIYCAAWVDGYIDAATKTVGPPPEGWRAENVQLCIEAGAAPTDSA